eukprot:CAMPEP_0119137706 /NCGR_PEP_ID=MMETSP1310-20130426/24172_1 /TAXON_ID=464262 /ORGANISM="Genus nov. species nov., Strain RCC2339" /LENGTH=152 /DNA_ID=CAMNT_0007128817 /DNA_START=133 /DNA_END=588 /DNA_ORIENTATION=+
MESSYFDAFVEAYEKRGGDKYMIEEEITQECHSLQAAHVAWLAGAPEDVVVGLLFHDVGQVIHEEYAGNTDHLHGHHDDLGSAWMLAHGFPQDVADLVQFHTLAKILLCEREAGYEEHLSRASLISLQVQRRKYGEEAMQPVVRRLRAHPRL